MTSANWGEALAVGLKAFIKDEFDKYEPIYPKIFEVFSTEKAYEEYVNSTSIGYMLKRASGSPVQYEDPLQGYKTRLTPQIFSKGMQAPKELSYILAEGLHTE